jgi:hypothetical protein
MSRNRWIVDVSFNAVDRFDTHADAVLTAGLDHLEGHGEARQRPSYPCDPAVGLELATARALEDLAHQLEVLADERTAAVANPVD